MSGSYALRVRGSDLTFLGDSCGGVDEKLWTAVVQLKTTAIQLWRSGSAGSKQTALKVVQRVVQTQTRGTADPRVRFFASASRLSADDSAS